MCAQFARLTSTTTGMQIIVNLALVTTISPAADERSVLTVGAGDSSHLIYVHETPETVAALARPGGMP